MKEQDNKTVKSTNFMQVVDDATKKLAVEVTTTSKSDPEKSAPEQEEQQPSVIDRTEVQKAALDKSKYSVISYLLTNSSGIVIMSLESEQDYKQGRWHYVPQDIPSSLQPEFSGKKYSFELYCTSDKNSQKRLKKLIRRFMPGVEVAFLPLNGGKYINHIDE